MVYSIENEFLSVSAETLGAQLKSIRSKKDGTEYLWQGDPKYWTGRAYNLFPIVGRLYGGKYSYGGKEYEMNLHGFARKTEFTVFQKQKSKIVFGISSTDETLKQYPFEFIFKVVFALKGNVLTVTYEVENIGENNMLFGLGGHPGFNVPFDKGEFTDYYLEFANKCLPKQLLLSENYLMSGEEKPYKLKEDKILPLCHGMFAFDAVILRDTDKKVYIKSKKTEKNISVEFPNMKYVGFWHKPDSDAPYVCIEPWENLPSFDGRIEKLEEKPDFKTLLPKRKYESDIIITVNE